MNEIFQAVQNAPVSPIELNGIDSLVTTETCLYAQGDEVIYYCCCFVVVVVVVVVVVIIIIMISYCLTFVCLQFSSTEFICALGEEKKSLCMRYAAPHLSEVSSPLPLKQFQCLFHCSVFSRKIVEQKPPFQREQKNVLRSGFPLTEC